MRNNITNCFKFKTPHCFNPYEPCHEIDMDWCDTVIRWPGQGAPVRDRSVFFLAFEIFVSEYNIHIYGCMYICIYICITYVYQKMYVVYVYYVYIYIHIYMYVYVLNTNISGMSPILYIYIPVVKLICVYIYIYVVYEYKSTSIFC